MGWAGHVARMGRGEVHTGLFFWWGYLRLGDHSSDPRVDGRVILKWIFKKWDGNVDGIDQARDKGRWRAPVNA